MEIFEPWSNTDKIVSGDSYFTLVGSAEDLRTIGPRFIRVFKTTTKQFPMKYLSEIYLVNIVNRCVFVTKYTDFLRVYSLSHEWIATISILLHPAHHFSRIDSTSEKGGGKLTDNIKNHIHRR